LVGLLTETHVYLHLRLKQWNATTGTMKLHYSPPTVLYKRCGDRGNACKQSTDMIKEKRM